MNQGGQWGGYMDEENRNERRNPSFESLDILISRWKDGSFSEIIDDWKWIFGYSARYKKAIIFYVILGIVSTSMGLVSSVASKYMIDIITGHETSRLWIMVIIMAGSTVFSLTFSSIISRISTKLSIDINNDIQADIFDKIVDADWLSLNKYSNGDILNRFNGDISTVSSNAISWLPTIIIAVYNFFRYIFCHHALRLDYGSDCAGKCTCHAFPVPGNGKEAEGLQQKSARDEQ